MGKEVLEGVSYSVTKQKNSLEALETFRAAPEAFDLVITDQTMAQMTGDNLAEELLNIRSDISIILCTGFSPKISPESTLAKGIMAYVQKPFTINELRDAVQKVMA